MNEMMTYQSSAPAAVGASGATTAMVTSRQAQEVQMAMYVAKTFPRDVDASWARIMNACQRKSLAEQAMYEYPRGGENVTGPSIRLAEAMAQNWGNLDFGITELEQKNGESSVMAYCWDLETNTRQTKIFTVPHIRQTKKGAIYPNVRGMIETVTKYSYSIDAGNTAIRNLESSDDVWIPCAREVCGSGTIESAGPRYSDLFLDNNARIKYRTTSTTAEVWWLRSGYLSSILGPVSVRRVMSNGSAQDSNAVSAENANGIALGFCTGRTPA